MRTKISGHRGRKLEKDKEPHKEGLNNPREYAVTECKQRKWAVRIARIWQVINEHKRLARQLKPLVKQRRKTGDKINMNIMTMKRPVAGQYKRQSTSVRARLLEVTRTCLLSRWFRPALQFNHSHIQWVLGALS
jgi:hypothetical protein